MSAQEFSLTPGETHPQVLRELVDEVSKPLSIIFDKLWWSGEVPTNWRRGIITPIFRWKYLYFPRKIGVTLGQSASPLCLAR